MARDRSERRQRERAGSNERDKKHRSGGDWTTITIPDGVDVFQPKEGSVRMDIVPYKVGEGNPFSTTPGKWYYERTFWTHRGVGPNNESYVCPSKTAHKPCPICEHRAALAKDPDADEKMIKDLKPKERQLFLVRIHGKDGDEPKLMLYESSHHTFGKLLDKKRQDADDDETHIINFDDADAGATLKVSYSEEDAGGYTFLEAYSIDFKPRPNGLDEDVLDHGICLDELVRVPSYEDLKRLYYQEPEDKEGDDEDDEPKKGKAKSKKDDDDDWDDEPKKEKSKTEKEPVKSKQAAKEPPDDTPTAKSKGIEEGMKVRHRKHGICEVRRISGDGTSLTLIDENDEIIKAIGVADVKLVEEEEKPKSKAKETKAKDDDDDDGWDDKPKKETKPSKAKDDDDDDGWGDDPKPSKGSKAGKSQDKDEDDWD